MAQFGEIAAQYRINGVIDTTRSVFENMEALALSAGVWTTYDIHAGRWSVIINRAGASTRSFDDSNIVGPIDVSSSGLTEYYNGVKVTYPRADMNDQTDFVLARTPSGDRLPNETDNILEMSLPLVNDPVQAFQIAAVELKQSRVNQVVVFTTDFSAIDVNAGDIIDVTSSALDWTNRLFRVISLAERDDTGESIAIEITALEYDPDVYVNDLIREDRSTTNEIVTIGAIGTPAAPTVTSVQRDARPRIIVTAAAPATGLVAGMEFWMSSDDSEYTLYGTERPPGGGVFAAGTSVEIDIGNFPTGSVYAKVRAVNSRTSSPFSAVTRGVFTVDGLPGGAETFDYEAFQIPDIITPDVKIEDGLGNLAAALGIIELLKLLDDLMSLGDTGLGSIFDKIFGLFEDETGVDILGDAGNIANAANSSVNTYRVVTVSQSGNTVTLPADETNQTLTLVGGTGINLIGNVTARSVTVSSTNSTAGLLTTGYVLNSSGPFAANTTISGSVANISTTVSRALFVAECNWGGPTGAPLVDDLRIFEMQAFKNGSQVTFAENSGFSTSVEDHDVFDDLNLQTTANIALAPGDTLQMKFVVESEAALLAGIGWAVFDASGVN
jgi:hypothetical protein